MKNKLVICLLAGALSVVSAEAKWVMSYKSAGWTAQVTDGTWTVEFHREDVTDGDGTVYSGKQTLLTVTGPAEGGDLDMSTLVEDVLAQDAKWESYLPVGMYGNFYRTLKNAKVTSLKLPGSMKVVSGWNTQLVGGTLVYNPYLTNLVVNAGLNTFRGGFVSFATNLVSVTGLETVRHFTTEAFNGCKKLRTIDPYLPTGVVSIAAKVFDDCPSLTGDLVYRSKAYRNVTVRPGKPVSVMFNDAITNIAVSFTYDTLESLGPFPADLRKINACFWDWSGTRLGNVNLPLAADFSACTNLTALPDAFAAGSVQLRTVVLPPRIRTIGTQAFAGCAKLTNIVFAADLRFRDEMTAASGTVGSQAFQNCVELKSAEFPWGGAETAFGGKCFAGAYRLRRLKFAGLPPGDLPASAFDWVAGTSGVGSGYLVICASPRWNAAAWRAFATREPTEDEKVNGLYPGPKTFGVYEYDYTGGDGVVSRRAQWLVWENCWWDLPQGMAVIVL